MVVGNYVQCIGCGHEYRIRYNLGGKFPQSASFFCKNCGESITYGYSPDRKVIHENITIINPKEGVEVINLHPELPIDETRQSDAMYFPSLEFLAKTDIEKDFLPLRRAQLSNIAYVKEWDNLAEDYRRLTEERWSLLQSKYGPDNAGITKTILNGAIRVAGIFLEGKWIELFDKVARELEKAEKHPDFTKLKSYLAEYQQEFMQHRMYQLMAQYRTVETELLSTLLDQKQGNKLTGLSSSAKWEKIERIYGDFYEVYGELAVIPTVINNLLSRNNYEQFATPGFTLEKYAETDKAKRCENFAANPNLQPLSNFFDASLRNGTHHKTAKINKAKQKIVLKTGKGGRSEKVWSFVEYTEHCNELYARCLILLIIFYKITS